MIDIPDAKKYCFYLPLRGGLLGLGYLKLACSVGVLFFVVYLTMLVVFLRILEGFILGFTIVIYLMLVLDIIFGLLLIVSAHNQNYKYVRIYYYYLMTELFNYLLLLITFIPWMLHTMKHTENEVSLVLGGAAFIFAMKVLHIYFVYYVRSEMRKLQLTTLVSFKSHFDDPECTAKIIQ